MPTNLLHHGHSKFPQAQMLCSSGNLGWRGIAAEMRSHPAGDLPPFVSSQVEITIAPQSIKGASVSRKGWGQRQQTNVEKGTIWISPIGVAEDDIRISGELPSILHIYLPVDRFLDLSEYEGGADRMHRVRYLAGVRDDLIVEIGRSLAEEMRNPTAAGKLLADSLAVSLAARLAQRYSDAGEAPPKVVRMRDAQRVRRAIEFMRESLEQDIGLDEIAGAAAVSPYHFVRLFRAATGVPPYRYLADLRMEQAKRLLAQGVVPLADIALLAQFSTQANFTRAFRKSTGMTPLEYRRKVS